MQVDCLANGLQPSGEAAIRRRGPTSRAIEELNSLTSGGSRELWSLPRLASLQTCM